MYTLTTYIYYTHIYISGKYIICHVRDYVSTSVSNCQGKKLWEGAELLPL